jgi:Icc-related predicted phosphoesterase
MECSLNIAVFADVHGRVALCFDLCARWQEATGETVDLILQAGDLGAFPHTAVLDSATKKHAEKDPTELGFSQHFSQQRPEIAALLAKTTAPLIFVRGNHEDHEWLDELEQPSRQPIFPIDVYQRVYCLKTGIPYRFDGINEHITITGIGRVGAGTRRSAPKPAHIQDYEIRQLDRHMHEKADILLTHDLAYGFLGDESGMEEIRLFLDINKPVYHFFGHISSEFDQMDENRVTHSIKLADLHFERTTSRLQAGSFGMMRWNNREDHQFEVVNEAWLDRYTSYGWKYR